MLYIIVSTSDNNKNKFHTYGVSNLGHELFWTRKIALVLLENNIIPKNACIVSKNNDRKFLYSKIFNNFVAYDDYATNQNDTEIDLT